jgi:hypothetical protein
MRHIKVENIHLKLNIDEVFGDDVKDVEVKNPYINWYISKVNKQLRIESSEPIHLLGYNSNGERKRNRDYNVLIPIKLSAFNSLPKSEAIRMRGNFGTAVISVIRKQLKPTDGKTFSKPPRYTAMAAATAPVITETDL